MGGKKKNSPAQKSTLIRKKGGQEPIEEREEYANSMAEMAHAPPSRKKKKMGARTLLGKRR